MTYKTKIFTIQGYLEICIIEGEKIDMIKKGNKPIFIKLNKKEKKIISLKLNALNLIDRSA